MKKILVGMLFNVVIYAQDSLSSVDSYSIALFVLAFVSIFILFIFSNQVMSIKKMYQKMFQKQQLIEEKQAKVLAQMGEKIQCMAQDVVTKCEHDDESYIPNKPGTKTELLDVTNDMIEFLKIKSKKIEITNEQFNLNNVLNEVSGRLAYKYFGSKVEIIFDIDKDVPRYLIGDSYYFGNIIYNILEYSMEYLVEKELKLSIVKKSKGKDKLDLKLEILNLGATISQEELDMFFVPQYDEEKQEYRGLGMFIAYELVKLMNGRIEATQKKNLGISFDIRLPFEYNSTELRKYRLPDKAMINKRVLIVDVNEDSAQALEKMFAYFKNKVDVLSSEKFNSKKPNFEKYDIVVLDEYQFSYRVVSYLNSLKQRQNLKVVALSSLLNINQSRYNDPIVDAILLKPVTQERVFELILSLYGVLDSEYINNRSKIKTYTDDIKPLPNINQESFRVFRGYEVLIVEDNVVNSRVLVNLLKPMGVKTTVANNGKEAVEILQKSPKDRFDLIIMDINMPVMDGFAATQTIRYDSKFDSLPILALTALVLDSEKKKMFNSGMNAYLSKPLDISKLYNAMQLFLEPKTGNLSTIHKKVVNNGDDNILNTQRGIFNSNENKLLYRELLTEFVEAYGESDAVFEKLVKEHRYEQLKMMTIDVRGITATIGAFSMNREVEAISKDIIFKRYEKLDEAVQIYKDELKELLKHIDNYLAEK